MEHTPNYHFQTSPTNPRVEFEHQGGGGWKVWDRYLTVDGKRAYHIGNICGTCQFLFKKLDHANRTFSATEISKRLEASNDLSDGTFLSFVSRILPADDYFVRVLRFTPRFTNPREKGDYFTYECPALFGYNGSHRIPHYPETSYYRDEGKIIAKGKLLVNFIIPLQQLETLDPERVDYYAQRYTNGAQPTALSLSVLDIKCPADRKPGTSSTLDEHWCLAHYLIDGHHKIHAAAQGGKECSLLCFISRKESFGGEDALYTLSECA